VSKTIRHTVTLLLTLCILLGSVGVALSEQLCLMTGMREYGAEKQMDACCDNPVPQTDDEEGCCTVALSFEKLEPVSSLKVFQLEAPVFFAVPFTPLFTTWSLSVATDQRVFTYADSSPPLYGRSLLHRLHILIV
jgi:hypothetical protein